MRRIPSAGRTGMLIVLLAAASACSRRENAATDTLASGASTGASAAAATATPNADFAGMTDANVASTIGVINSGEIQAAQVATRKATSADTKAFARDMIKEHTAMQNALDSLLAAKNVVPETSPKAESIKSEAKAMQDSLSAMPAASFDSAYINGQVADHQKALDALNGMVNSVQDADMRAAIQAAIPKVQAHLDRARSLAAAHGGANTSSPSTK